MWNLCGIRCATWKQLNFTYSETVYNYRADSMHSLQYHQQTYVRKEIRTIILKDAIRHYYTRLYCFPIETNTKRNRNFFFWRAQLIAKHTHSGKEIRVAKSTLYTNDICTRKRETEKRQGEKRKRLQLQVPWRTQRENIAKKLPKRGWQQETTRKDMKWKDRLHRKKKFRKKDEREKDKTHR